MEKCSARPHIDVSMKYDKIIDNQTGFFKVKQIIGLVFSLVKILIIEPFCHLSILVNVLLCE